MDNFVYGSRLQEIEDVEEFDGEEVENINLLEKSEQSEKIKRDIKSFEKGGGKIKHVTSKGELKDEYYIAEMMSIGRYSRKVAKDFCRNNGLDYSLTLKIRNEKIKTQNGK